jgi:uncharacterized membrane protein (UPF0127 family)
MTHVIWRRNLDIRHCALFVIYGLFAGILGMGCSRPPARAVNQVCFKDKCFDVEVVQKKEELQRGLQLREFLDSGSGMLFVFPHSRPYSFWMKDTLISLDMIWMDYARRIVYIEHDVPPCAADPCPRYTPPHEALYVLEINAGYARKMGVQLGDTAEFLLNAVKM